MLEPMKQRDTRPRWLSDGSETCGICRHGYTLEMEYRCVACDRGVCEQCGVLVRETAEVFCLECRSLQED